MAEKQWRIRAYVDADYAACEALVSNTWKFEKNFPPPKMAELVGYLYTMGSVAGSNFRMVAEAGDRVVGFLFGFNEYEPLQKSELQGVIAQLSILRRLFFIKGMRFKEKTGFLKSIGIHDTNKTRLKGDLKSELVLFVIAPEYQGQGIGQRLVAEFIGYCKASNVKSIVVETNKLGASGFYKRVGFTHKGNFDSPLHEYATKNGQACLYEYSL